jgi:hypothetical protein
MLIDIDQSLAAAQGTPTFWIEFGDGDEPPAIEIEVKQREQRRLVNKYIRAAVADGEMSIAPDWYSLGLAIVPYAKNWRGFAGQFDRGKLKQWLEVFGAHTEALGQAFKSLLDKYEEQVLKYQEAIEKNS